LLDDKELKVTFDMQMPNERHKAIEEMARVAQPWTAHNIEKT
jgi:hypothetical protein